MINNQTQYDSEENKKRYDLEQKKRAHKRRIRETKRELYEIRHAIDATKDENLIAQLKEREKELKLLFDKQYDSYNAFCKQNGVKRSDDRLYVSKNNVTGYEDWIKKNVAKSSESDKINSTETKEDLSVHKVGEIDKEFFEKHYGNFKKMKS